MLGDLAIATEDDPAEGAQVYAQGMMVEPETPFSKGYEGMSTSDLTFLQPTVVEDEALAEDGTEYNFPDHVTLMDVVGVKLQASGPIHLFDCQNMHFGQGDAVIVETNRGLVWGEVVVPARRRLVREDRLPRVARLASQSDLRQFARNKEREDAAFRLCKERIERLGLDMKLVRVEYLHGGNKAVFYFSSDGRIDFRELVRELSRRLHTRIEMRQIGVRDASRMLGGIGSCGCRLCCNAYLREFQPVSIRMAKDQNLVLNPQRVSGICGRLLCCLIYEDDVYRDAARSMPRVGRRVNTPDGEGRIRDRDVLKRLVRVQLSEEHALREYSADEVSPISATRNSLPSHGQNDEAEQDAGSDETLAALERAQDPAELAVITGDADENPGSE